MSKMEIVKDGEIQGSYISTLITLVIFTMLVCGFFVESIRVAWERFGTTISTIYLGQLTVWLAYRGSRAIFTPTPPTTSNPMGVSVSVK